MGVQPRNRTYTNRVRVGEWVRAGAPVRALALWFPLVRGAPLLRCGAVESWSAGVLECWSTGVLEYGARGAPLRVRPLSYRPLAGLTGRVEVVVVVVGRVVGCCVGGSWSTGALEYLSAEVLGPTALSPIGQRPGYMVKHP